MQNELPSLIPLSNGQSGLRSVIQIEAHEPSPSDPASSIQNPASCVLDFIASDETLDRYGEIISATGWRLENYRRNPVFQNSHQYGDVIFTLGKALITEVRSSNSNVPSPYLFQRIEFATEVNPMARIAYGLYKGKFLNAVSVGFIPVRWVNGDSESLSGRGEEALNENSGLGGDSSEGGPAVVKSTMAGVQSVRQSVRQSLETDRSVLA